MASTEIYSSGLFKHIIDKCEGCDRIIENNNNKFCTSYSNPESKWRLGLCNFATHAKIELAVSQVKVNPLKASKRAMGKK
ncbi:MAG: PxxKW family cysteine-rich protein [Proteobacteria bacterium]|nr:PxxKW family cysteine-rich protein [Pseudomonadota bacterium]MBU1711116.1 PxxKW family cysteine-rich protein [Pseudomonadota bacterium]